MRFVLIGQFDAHAEVSDQRPLRVDAHCREVEQHGGGRGRQDVDVERVGRTWRDAARQFLRAGEIDVAPRTGFGLIGQLGVDAGEQFFRRSIARFGEDDVIQQRCRPTIFPGRNRGARARQHRVGAAHRGDVQPGRGFRRQRVEMGRIRVVPAHVALVHGLAVVAHRAVVATVEPLRGQRLRQRQPLCDLAGGVAGVHQAY